MLAVKKITDVSCGDIIINDKAIGTKEQMIYFDDRLTKYKSDLFYEARKLKKDEFYKFVWTKGGKVLMRKTDNSKLIVVESIEHLAKLKREFTNGSGKRQRSSTPVDSSDEDPIGIEDKPSRRKKNDGRTGLRSGR